jgi:hypothetical protein
MRRGKKKRKIGRRGLKTSLIASRSLSLDPVTVRWKERGDLPKS